MKRQAMPSAAFAVRLVALFSVLATGPSANSNSPHTAFQVGHSMDRSSHRAALSEFWSSEYNHAMLWSLDSKDCAPRSGPRRFLASTVGLGFAILALALPFYPPS